ncbi:MAG: NfeD family protein [Desulfocapsaceae bacterium]|nr:NfeD family protein [Desulfocapsaceae bacterium]
MTLTTAGLMWLIMGIICFLLEMMLPGFIIFFFGLGAWITALVCWLYPVPLNIQLAIFLVSSLMSLFILRGIIRNTFFGEVTADETDVSATAGDSATVSADIIPPAEGKIDYSGTQWRAVADEKIIKGTIVTILSQDGLCMKVAPKDNN